MIAMALSCRPKLLIADEPTTALDVTIQAQILQLIKELQAEFGMALIMITHDLGVIAETVDRVVVMYGGRVMEQGPVQQIFDAPTHSYTQSLLAKPEGRRDPAGAGHQGDRRAGARASRPVEDLSGEAARPHLPQRDRRARRARGQPRAPAQQHRRARRRVGLGQEHDRDAGDAADRSDRRSGASSTATTSAGSIQRR